MCLVLGTIGFIILYSVVLELLVCQSLVKCQNYWYYVYIVFELCNLILPAFFYRRCLCFEQASLPDVDAKYMYTSISCFFEPEQCVGLYWGITECSGGTWNHKLQRRLRVVNIALEPCGVLLNWCPSEICTHIYYINICIYIYIYITFGRTAYLHSYLHTYVRIVTPKDGPTNNQQWSIHCRSGNGPQKFKGHGSGWKQFGLYEAGLPC